MDLSEQFGKKCGMNRAQGYVFSALCACVLCCAGCFTGKPPVNRPPAIAFAHPVIPTTASSARVEEPPDIEVDLALPPKLNTPRAYPPKPKLAPTASAEPAVAQQPADPIIVPDLRVEQLSTAISETQHSLDIAEWNLSQTQGKKLNTAQEDVVSKIRGFMETSRDAMKTGDWQRAKNLAKKAEVLSHELVADL